MISTELVTRVLLTVIIVGALSIDYSSATNKTESNIANTEDDDSSLDSKTSPSSSFSSTANGEESLQPYFATENDDGDDDVAESRLMHDSAEAGILLPPDEDFPRPGGQEVDSLPSSVSFLPRPIALRIDSGKASGQPRAILGKEYGKFSKNGEKSTYFVRNSCFGPRCPKQQLETDTSVKPMSTNPYGNWETVYKDKKEMKARYDGMGYGNSLESASTKYEDNIMETVSSNIHSQLQIPFMVIDPSKSSSSFAKRSGLDRYSRMTTPSPNPSTEGWVKLKAISSDAYDPFRVVRNNSSTFTKRDSSMSGRNSFSKRVGVELNPESFADRWGWSAEGESNKGGGSRFPAWLEEQLKYGTRNSDQGKNWVKLEPIPVAGVTISKWVPKGTQTSDLPTTSWQTNRDRPNGGSPWWDRVDDTRFLTGARPGGTNFLRPQGGSSNEGNYNGGGNNNNNGWGSKGSGLSLSSLDRYPTNSWNDIIYPEGPTSATVSWQQNKGGISNYPSSFGVSGSGATVGWTSPEYEKRKPMVGIGGWSSPQNNRFPSFINRFNEHRPSSSSFPVKQASQDDPRWVLISNTRVTSGATSNTRRQDLLDRSKILQYINRLHPDLDRRSDFPFYEPPPPSSSSSSPSSSSSWTSHRNGKDFWQWPFEGTLSNSALVSKDEAFKRVNATLSTLNPVLLNRRTTMTPLFASDPANGRPSRLEGNFNADKESGDGSSSSDFSDVSTLPPHLSSYIGDGRGTSSNVHTFLQPTSTTIRNTIPGRIRQGLQNINPVYAAVGAGMLPATLAAVMPMMLGKRKRRDVANIFSHRQRYRRMKSLLYLPYLRKILT